MRSRGVVHYADAVTPHEATKRLLRRLWRDGPGIDDRDSIEKLSLECDSSDVAFLELRSFLAWLNAMEGHDVGAPLPLERRDLAAVAAATRLRVAINIGDIDEVEAWMGLVLAEPAAAYGPIVEAMIDLAIIDVGLFAHNHSTVEARAEQLAEEGRPVVLRMQAIRRLVSISLGRADFAGAEKLAHTMMELAKESARPKDAEHAGRLHALCMALGGRKVKATDDLVGELGISMVESPTRALARLTTVQRKAGAQGDPMVYMLAALLGARRYLELEQRVDAWLTVSTAIVLFKKHDPEFAAPLEEEREKWLAAWGPFEYERVMTKALAIADKHGR